MSRCLSRHAIRTELFTRASVVFSTTRRFLASVAKTIPLYILINADSIVQFSPVYLEPKITKNLCLARCLVAYHSIVTFPNLSLAGFATILKSCEIIHHFDALTGSILGLTGDKSHTLAQTYTALLPVHALQINKLISSSQLSHSFRRCLLIINIGF